MTGRNRLKRAFVACVAVLAMAQAAWATTAVKWRRIECDPPGSGRYIVIAQVFDSDWCGGYWGFWWDCDGQLTIFYGPGERIVGFVDPGADPHVGDVVVTPIDVTACRSAVSIEVRGAGEQLIGTVVYDGYSPPEYHAAPLQ